MNTQDVPAVWSPYLAAYSWIVYGVGALCDTHLIRNIVGLSVFPWLKQGINADLIKLICDSVDEENDDDLI